MGASAGHPGSAPQFDEIVILQIRDGKDPQAAWDR